MTVDEGKEGGGPLGLRYGVLIQNAAGEFVETEPDGPFTVKDRLKLTFEPNQDGYLYVLQNDGANWSVLYPQRRTRPVEGRVGAMIERGHRYTIPSSGQLTFDPRARPQIVVVFSRSPVADSWLEAYSTELESVQGGRQERDAMDAPETRLARWRSEGAKAPLIVEKVDFESHREDALYLVKPASEFDLFAELLFAPLPQ